MAFPVTRRESLAAAWLGAVLAVCALAVWLWHLKGGDAMFKEGAFTTIEWDYAGATVVYGDGLNELAMAPKLLRLASGELLCAYKYASLTSPRQHSVRISRSLDDGKTWAVLSDVVTSATNYATPHMVQLKDGTLLIAYRVGDLDELRYLHVQKSVDGGRTWQFLSEVAGGAHYAEPYLLLKSTGELLAFYATETTKPQAIALKRSFDNGATWGPEELVSHNPSSRDGMPIPLFVGGNDNDIIVAMEASDEKGYDFVAKTVRSTDGGKTWGPRFLAYKPEGQAKRIRAAAPDLLQLASGELALSFHTDESMVTDTGDERNVETKVVMSSDLGASWSRKSVPFGFGKKKEKPDDSARAAWSSLFQLDRDTVVVATSYAPRVDRNIPANAKPGDYVRDYVVKMMRGKIKRADPAEHKPVTDSSMPGYSAPNDYLTAKTVFGEMESKAEREFSTGEVIKKPMEIAFGTPKVDGNIGDEVWKSSSPQMIGVKGSSNKAYFKASYDRENLYIYGRVLDLQHWSDSGDAGNDDGIGIMIDRRFDRAAAPQPDDFRLAVSIGGAERFTVGKGDGSKSWNDWSPQGIQSAVMFKGTEYAIEVKLPWPELGGAPAAGEFIGLNFINYEDDDSGPKESSATVAGNVPDEPAKWSAAILKPEK